MPMPTPHSKSYRKRVALISTGGTIEKTYDEMEGVLRNEVSNLDVMLAGLELEGVVLTRVPLAGIRTTLFGIKNPLGIKNPRYC